MEKIIRSVGLEKILEHSPVGIHVIDKKGKTILYNESMGKLEGLSVEKVLEREFFEVFPTLNKDTSTLIKVMKSGDSIINRMQTYNNINGREITTINTTVPLVHNEHIIGALEISNNLTHVREMADNLISLQKEIQSKNLDTEFGRYRLEDLIGLDEEFVKLKKIAKLAGNSSSSVLIYGETGTGKELFAQSIHYSGVRKDKPFIAQNCAAIPETLLESILFGTEKGSFTGAIESKGIFEQANGGTLLLDEINSMSTDLQAKLLRVLQESYIRRVGGKKDIPIDVRIIATTNQEPLKGVECGNIRKDLYYRLNVISMSLPLLRDRKSDLDLLANHFIKKYNGKLNRSVENISDEILSKFKEYNWPGNIRELENVIEAAMNLTNINTSILDTEHFVTSMNLWGSREQEKLELEEKSITEYLEKIEKDIIQNILKDFKYNVTESAKKLGISRQSLQYKMKKYELE